MQQVVADQLDMSQLPQANLMHMGFGNLNVQQ